MLMLDAIDLILMHGRKAGGKWNAARGLVKPEGLIGNDDQSPAPLGTAAARLCGRGVTSADQGDLQTGHCRAGSRVFPA